VAQFVEHFQEMANAPCDSIEGRDEHDVKVMSPDICQQLVEPGSLRFAPRNYVSVLLHDFISTLFGHFAEVKQLGFKMLVAS
jgi:hypothetical protein